MTVISSSISTGIDYLIEIFNNTNLFGSEYIIQIMIIILSILLISRQKEDWKILALPVILGWVTFTGINISLIFLVPAAVIFSIEALSIKSWSDVVSGMKTVLVPIGRATAAARRHVPIFGQGDQLTLERQALKAFRKDERFAKLHGATMTQMLENLRKGSAAYPKLQAQLDGVMRAKAKEDAYTPTIKEDVWPNIPSMGRLDPKGSAERRREMLDKYKKQQAQQSSIARQMAAPLGSALSAFNEQTNRKYRILERDAIASIKAMPYRKPYKWNPSAASFEEQLAKTGSSVVPSFKEHLAKAGLNLVQYLNQRKRKRIESQNNE